MDLKIEATNVFERNWQAYNNKDIRYIANQGGSRSSKSFSILQCLIIIALKEKKKITIVRKTLASCKTIMDDLFELLIEYDLYDRDRHNKSSSTYDFENGSQFEFIGVTDVLKLRGKKRDILFCNEVNELIREEWVQLMLRTSGKVFLDFNPSDTDHFVYDLVKDDNAILIKSTYLDNPFLQKDQVDYIKNLINVDENYYKIYTLGEKPTSTSRVYTHFKQYMDEPQIEDISYGLDFGFTHPTCLVESKFIDNKVYVKELIYESGLTAQDLINKMNTLPINRSKKIYCDYARPEMIEELKRAGFRAELAKKDVKPGIDKVKSIEVLIHNDSINLWREYRLYSWKVINDIVTEEIVKLNDDGMDSLRYSIYSHLKSNKFNPAYAKIY